MIITAEINEIRYVTKLARKLDRFRLSALSQALATNASFELEIDQQRVLSVSWWVSAKRTRSYPYARVYDTLASTGKKVTIIPIFKDEGADGDRDFLQWDTVSLMSLLGVFVIIGYYASAKRSSGYKNKITEQRFDTDYLRSRLKEVTEYPSDPLRWNLSQMEKVGQIGQKALSAYGAISRALKVQMHSAKSAQTRISELMKGRDVFMALSRRLAERAQGREIVTVQPKEKLSGTKAAITIQDKLGGKYFFTVDEATRLDSKVLLVEGKHTKENRLPSREDIKDGLLRMIVYTNLQNVLVDGKRMSVVPVLLLTTGPGFSSSDLSSDDTFGLVSEEAMANRFQVSVNNPCSQSLDP